MGVLCMKGLELSDRPNCISYPSRLCCEVRAYLVDTARYIHQRYDKGFFLFQILVTTLKSNVKTNHVLMKP